MNLEFINKCKESVLSGTGITTKDVEKLILLLVICALQVFFLEYYM